MNNLRFKAYHKKDKCWIDGFSIHSSGLFSDLINAKNVNGICIADAHWERIADLEHIEIVQYTGFNDKYGRDVYDNDVLKVVSELYTNFGKTPTGEYVTSYVKICRKEDSWGYEVLKKDKLHGLKVGHVSKGILSILKYGEVVGSFHELDEFNNSIK